MVRNVTAILAGILLFMNLISCTSHDSTTNISQNNGSLNLSITLGRVGSLSKATATAVIELSKLYIEISSAGQPTIYDSIDISGNQQTTVVKAYSDITPSIEWEIAAYTKDLSGEIIHSASQLFSVDPGKVVSMSIDMPSKYSMILANFNSIPDGATTCELAIDGQLMVGKGVSNSANSGDTVTLSYDYVSSSPEGITHSIRMNVRGEIEGVDLLLYTAESTITTISGADTSYHFTLRWVGPDMPSSGQLSLDANIGSRGTIVINGDIPKNNIVPGKFIARWSFLNISGNTIMDLSGNGHNGTLNRVVNEDGLLFFQSKGWIHVPDDEAFKLSSALTIDAYVNISGYPAYTGDWNWGIIFLRGDNGGSRDPYYIAVAPDSTLNFHIEDSTKTWNELRCPVSLNRWSYICAVFDGSQKTMMIYIDGELKAKRATTVVPLSELSFGTCPGIGIGNTMCGDWMFPFDGKIKEVSLADYAYTPDMVRIRYTELKNRYE